MARILAQFLSEQARAPFIWGASDCAMFIADWVAACTGADPADHLRGRYFDRAGASGIAPDGLAGIVAVCAQRARLEPTTADDIVGSIAVLRGPGGDICAIRSPIGWVMRDRRAVVTLPNAQAALLQCWIVPNG